MMGCQTRKISARIGRIDIRRVFGEKNCRLASTLGKRDEIQGLERKNQISAYFPQKAIEGPTFHSPSLSGGYASSGINLNVKHSNHSFFNGTEHLTVNKYVPGNKSVVLVDQKKE